MGSFEASVPVSVSKGTARERIGSSPILLRAKKVGSVAGNAARFGKDRLVTAREHVLNAAAQRLEGRLERSIQAEGTGDNNLPVSFPVAEPFEMSSGAAFVNSGEGETVAGETAASSPQSESTMPEKPEGTENTSQGVSDKKIDFEPVEHDLNKQSIISFEKEYTYLQNDLNLMEHAHLPKERGGFEGYRDWAYEQFVMENPTLLSSNFAGFKEVSSKDSEIGKTLQRILARRKERLEKQPVKISGVSQKVAQEQGVTPGPVSTPSHEVAMQEPGDKLRTFLQNHPHVAFDATQFDVLANQEFTTSYNAPRRILLAAAKDSPITIIDIPDMDKNQDSVAYEKRDDGIVNIAVADGVTGAVRGDLSSRVAVRAVVEQLRDQDISLETLEYVNNAIQRSDTKAIVEDFIASIRRRADEATDDALKWRLQSYADQITQETKEGNYSSTMVIAAQYDRGNNRLRVALKGDSQVVVINHEGMQAPIEGKMRDQIVYGDLRPFDEKEVIFQEISLADGDVVLIQTDGSESARDPLKTKIEQFVRDHRGEQNLDRLLAKMIGEELFTQTPDDDITTVILCHKAIDGEKNEPEEANPVPEKRESEGQAQSDRVVASPSESGEQDDLKLAEAPFSPGATADAASKSKSPPSKYVPSPPPLLVQSAPFVESPVEAHLEPPFVQDSLEIILDPGKRPMDQIREFLRNSTGDKHFVRLNSDQIDGLAMSLDLIEGGAINWTKVSFDDDIVTIKGRATAKKMGKTEEPYFEVRLRNKPGGGIEALDTPIVKNISWVAKFFKGEIETVLKGLPTRITNELNTELEEVGQEVAGLRILSEKQLFRIDLQKPGLVAESKKKE